MRHFTRTLISYHCCFFKSLLHKPTIPSNSSSFLKPMPPRKMNFFTFAADNHRRRRKDKIIVILGATGSGKSRLSVDIGTRFMAEIINSDKIQVYTGLNIATNKIPLEEQLGVPHHLLGDVDSSAVELTQSQYRSRASSVISGIISRRRIPLIVGGSNSFIYALLTERFDPESDVFSGIDPVSSELRHNCCFLWIDLSLPVLNEYLCKRVDEMLDSGMMDELREFYNSEINDWEPNLGLRKAIGVPEFERYFTACDNDQVREDAYKEGVKAIKDNTCRLAKKQIEKIQRLKNGGWDLHRLDASDSFRAVLEGSKRWTDIWVREIVEPSVKIVNRFLKE